MRPWLLPTVLVFISIGTNSAFAVELIDEACPRSLGEPLTSSGVFSASQIRCRLGLGQSESEIEAEIEVRRDKAAAEETEAVRLANDLRKDAMAEGNELCEALKTELDEGGFLLPGSPLRALFTDGVGNAKKTKLIDQFAKRTGRSPFGMITQKQLRMVPFNDPNLEYIRDLASALGDLEYAIVEQGRLAQQYDLHWPSSHKLAPPPPISYAIQCLYLAKFGELWPKITN